MHISSDTSVAGHGLMPQLHHAMLTLVRREGPDLTARQLAILLTVYLDDGPHTVRDLATRLDICKPAVSRALDRLGELDLARRRIDPTDRRSVFVLPTRTGWTFLAELRAGMGATSAPGGMRAGVCAAELAGGRWAEIGERRAANDAPLRYGPPVLGDAGNVTALRGRLPGDPDLRPRADGAPRAAGSAAAGDMASSYPARPLRRRADA